VVREHRASDLTVVSGLLLAIVWLSFGCVMDGHVLLRACTFCVIAYLAAVAAMLVVGHGQPLGRLEWSFIVVGWVPLVAAGIPMLLWLWRTAGWIR
jgi:hypothetical protein